MLAPDKDVVNSFLANFLKSYQSITLAAISLQQSQFYPPSNQPDWMVSLNTTLADAQSVTSDWLTDKGPSVAAKIPFYFTNYSTSVQIVAKTINDPNTTKAEALRLLNWLKTKIAVVPQQEKALYGILDTFTKNFQQPKSVIESSLADAQKDIKADQKKTQELTNQISQLYQDISAETVTASNGMTSVITSGASLSVGLLSFSYAVASGAVFGPVGVAVSVVVAIGGITIGAITNAINQQKIADNLAKIKDLQVSLLQENQAIAILQNVSTMLTNLDLAITGIQKAVDISGIWTDEMSKLNDVISLVDTYPGKDFQQIPDIKSFAQAAQAWAAISTMATNVQKAFIGMPNVVVTINNPSEQLVAVKS